jgi:putative transposase
MAYLFVRICFRVVWNRTLAWRHARYYGEQARTNFTEANAYLTEMKASEDLGWLNEVSSVPLQQAIRHQQVAFSNFFAGRARHPRYKSRNGRQSAEYTRSGFRYRKGQLLLAKMSTPLEFAWSWPDVDPASIEPTTVTVSRDPCGRCRLDRRERNLARYQRRLARRQKDSANRVKAKAKVARAHRKVRASRADFLHRTSTRLVRDHDVIVIEDQAVKNMVRNRSLAKAISDCGWGEFRRQLEYKAATSGRHLIVIDRWHPSSKTCSACGHLLAQLSLSTRTWQCPSCGTRNDRDINAAKNILAAGLAVSACGGDVRHSGSSRVRSPVKQEPRLVTAGIPILQGGE